MTLVYFLIIGAYILAFGLTFFGVEKFRQWSLRRKLLDIPNERSSHTEPTPRGGGIVLAFVCLSILLGYCLYFEIRYFWVYFAGAFIVGFVSWLDDLFSVSVFWRFSAHSLAAFLTIWSLGFWERIYLPFYGEIFLGNFGILLTFFWIVWFINAYNFMDGIDGIAGVQAVTAGIGWFLIGILLNLTHTGFYGGIIALSALAFLFHNWQPAKIFLGDVGSAFLGYSFAVMPLLAKSEIIGTNKFESFLPLIGILLVITFLFDSLFTFLKRLLRFEKIWQAHREHIYQKLVIRGFSHRAVTLIYGITSVVIGIFLILYVKFGLNFTFSSSLS